MRRKKKRMRYKKVREKVGNREERARDEQLTRIM